MSIEEQESIGGRQNLWHSFARRERRNAKISLAVALGSGNIALTGIVVAAAQKDTLPLVLTAVGGIGALKMGDQAAHDYQRAATFERQATSLEPTLAEALNQTEQPG